MKRMGSLLLLFAVAVFSLSSCQGPRIDGSSSRRLEESLEKMREAMPESQRGAFDEALRQYFLVRISQEYTYPAGIAAIVKGDLQELRQELDGMTAAQFMQKSAEVLKEQEKGQVEALAEKSAEEIAKLEISNVAIEDGKATFTIKNNFPLALTRTDFTLTLSYPNSGQPFARDTVAGNIPMGGLEPGMTQDWIIPIDFMDNVPEGTALDVKVVAAHCANDLCRHEVKAEPPLYAE
jgi:hypothetical protein